MRRILWTALLLCLCRVSFALGTLKVTSEPSGVVVSLDGKRVARTPCKLGVPPGEHTVSAEAKRYDSDSKTVSIKDGKETSIHLTLLPTPIEIKVKCKVEEAQVQIDGEEAGLVNKVVKARPGSRELVVVKDGYKDYVRKIKIPWRTTGKKPKEYAAKLTPGISFRSGTLLRPGGWYRTDGWRFVNGRMVYDSGDKAKSKRYVKRGKIFALMCRYRMVNASGFMCFVGEGRIHSFKNDGKWHVLLLQVDGREGTWTVDGKLSSKTSMPEGNPIRFIMDSKAPANNEPFRVEIGMLVLRQFKSVAEMKAAVRP